MHRSGTMMAEVEASARLDPQPGRLEHGAGVAAAEAAVGQAWRTDVSGRTSAAVALARVGGADVLEEPALAAGLEHASQLRRGAPGVRTVPGATPARSSTRPGSRSSAAAASLRGAASGQDPHRLARKVDRAAHAPDSTSRK